MLHGEHRQDHGDAQQGEDGDDPGEQRDAEVLHGDGGQIGDDEVQHQLRRLQLTDLSLAHEADARDDEQI